MEIHEKVKHIESNFDVNQLLVKTRKSSFQIYPWLKVRLFHKHLMGVDVLVSKSKKQLLSQLSSIFYGFHNFFRRYDFWCFTNSSERTLIEDKYYDKLFDFIGNNYPKKTLLIELRLLKKYRRKDVSSKYVVSKSIFALAEEVYALLFVRVIKIEHKEIITAINSFLDCGVDEEAIIRKNIAQYQFMKFCLKILPNPKVVFLTVSYSNFGYIRAFKEKGIKVIEMQHGLIGNNHYAYYYHATFDPIQFPDEIFVFGTNEKDFFEHNTTFPVKNSYPVGRYIIDYYFDKSKEVETFKSACVSLQDGDYGDELIQFLLDYSLEFNSKTHFIIQPRRTSECYYRSKFKFPSNFIFSTKNVYETIAESDFHITIFSTTAVEALSIGKQNILVNLNGKAKENLSEQLEANPYTFFVDNNSQFHKTLMGLVATPKKTIAASNNINMAENYKYNITALLDELTR